MSERLPACSVVIRAFNEERHIGRLLDGVRQQTVQNAEIVVVDSGSTDATRDLAASVGARVVTIAPEEFSFGRSLNRGCAAARAPIVVIASAHVYPVYRDWLERLLAPFEEADVALVYGRQRGDERTRYSERQVFAAWFPDHGDPAQTHPFCNNANAAIRRSVWEGLRYDETLTGLEDVAWAKAALAQGRRICYEPRAEVVHVHEETPARLFNRYRREAMALRRIFPEERFDLADLVRLVAVNVTSDLLHARRERAFWRQAAGVLVFRLMQFWGTYRGFAQHGPVTSRLRRTFYYPRTRTRAAAGGEVPRGVDRVEYHDAPPAGRPGREGPRPS